MRITTSIIMFWIWFTSAAALLESVGVTAAMGVPTSVSAGDKLSEATAALKTISSGGVSAESVVGLYTMGTSVIETFLVGLTAGPRIMVAVGLPMEFVIFLHAPIGLLGGRMFIYMLAQRSL